MNPANESITRVPSTVAPPGASMVRLSTPGRSKSILGYVHEVGGENHVPSFTPDGFGAILYPSPTSLRKAAGGSVGKGKKEGKAGLQLEDGDSVLLECDASISPTRSWALVSAYVEFEHGHAMPTCSVVVRSDRMVPRFLVTAAGGSLIISEDTALGVVCVLA